MPAGLYWRERSKSYWGSYGEIHGLLKFGVFSVILQYMFISYHNLGSRVLFFFASRSCLRGTSSSPNAVNRLKP